MMSMLVLACVCMLPALVVAEVYSLGGCDANFNDQLDQVALTQEGVMKMAAFGAAGPSSLYVWNPSSAEKGFKNLALSLSMTAKTFSLSYKNSTNGTVTIAGNATYQQTPKIMLKLDTGINKNTYQGIFSFNDKGVADLYPLYISTTDVILRGCNGAFLGKQESLYVFTTNNYTSLNTTCAIQTVKTLNGWTVIAA